MQRFLRHLSAVLVFPVMVTIVIPVWIASAREIDPTVPATAAGWAAWALAAPILAAGLAFFLASLRRFDSEGDGTLAPWDPPAKLVVGGPYAHVRNPMISGVILILGAEALLLRSGPHFAWAGLFALGNAIYIPLLEEPMLRSRFGDAYDEYRANVPRLLPRIRPWTQSESSPG